MMSLSMTHTNIDKGNHNHRDHCWVESSQITIRTQRTTKDVAITTTITSITIIWALYNLHAHGQGDRFLWFPEAGINQTSRLQYDLTGNNTKRMSCCRDFDNNTLKLSPRQAGEVITPRA